MVFCIHIRIYIHYIDPLHDFLVTEDRNRLNQKVLYCICATITFSVVKHFLMKSWGQRAAVGFEGTVLQGRLLTLSHYSNSQATGHSFKYLNKMEQSQ